MSDPTETKEGSGRRVSRRIPLIVIGVGLLLVPVTFLISDIYSHPHWNWDTSFFGHDLAPIFLSLSFFCSCVPPFFMQVSESRKCLYSICGAFAFGIAVGGSFLLSMILFGSGIG
jgi:ABC-type sulfate transport system permease component